MKTNRAKLPGGVRITEKKPELEPGVPWTGYIDPKHIKPNPKQPRKVFPEEHQKTLQSSHRAVGQRRAISVVPYKDNENPEIWFMIEDGERSWRSLTELHSPAVLVICNPLSNLEDIGFHSFVANFGGRGHTHAEIIDAVWDEVKNNGRSAKEFAEAVTKSEVWVGNYLYLHNLHPELIKLLDSPTPKNDRISFNLALIISKAEQSEQLNIYKKTHGMSSKVAIRTARKNVDEGVQVQGRRQKPSDQKKILLRILRTVDEDIRYMRDLPDDVLNSASFDRELIEAHLAVILTIGLKAFRRISGGKKFDVVDEKSIAELVAKRRFGSDGKKGMGEISLDDIIPTNRGRAEQTR